jgi:hypothetical protein
MSDSFESAKLPIHRHQWERDCVVIFRTAGGVGECLLLSNKQPSRGGMLTKIFYAFFRYTRKVLPFSGSLSAVT